MIQPLRINVVFCYVADVEKALDFYGRVLGLGTPTIETDEWIEFELPGGANFALHRTTPEALEGSDPTRNTLRFSLVVRDLTGAIGELERAGVRLLRGVETGPGFSLVEFLDPEGNEVRLIEFDGEA